MRKDKIIQSKAAAVPAPVPPAATATAVETLPDTVTKYNISEPQLSQSQLQSQLQSQKIYKPAETYQDTEQLSKWESKRPTAASTMSLREAKTIKEPSILNSTCYATESTAAATPLIATATATSAAIATATAKNINKAQILMPNAVTTNTSRLQALNEQHKKLEHALQQQHNFTQQQQLHNPKHSCGHKQQLLQEKQQHQQQLKQHQHQQQQQQHKPLKPTFQLTTTTKQSVSLFHLCFYVMCVGSFGFSLYCLVRQSHADERLRHLRQLDDRIDFIELQQQQLQLQLQQLTTIHVADTNNNYNYNNNNKYDDNMLPPQQFQETEQSENLHTPQPAVISAQAMRLLTRQVGDLQRLRRDVSQLQLTRRQQRRQAAMSATNASGGGALGPFGEHSNECACVPVF
ncbi:GATA zinc finger domain-containing protein 10-like [Teleopsis dalmanni]|uniref:GATA zinc finger domain-containing protein 10-like n=1 Tax=Teleopsis dalmanni TaxID=139649 RepID=UPI0018CE3881|nr:GATA zinc finger domain-containing protein 10-like [Teleopsis dalmanni]